MKFSTLIALFAFASCKNQDNKTMPVFKHIIPDTAKTWAGRMTQDCYHQTRNLELKLGIPTLLKGVKNNEIRIWQISGSYDPQVLLIAQQDYCNNWTLRTISYYKTKADSIYSDNVRLLRHGAVDSFNLNFYWNLPSQSDLKAGDSYGCFDSEDVFIEMADSLKYRFMWYRCPFMNKDKDSVFRLASELSSKLNSLTVNP